MLLWIALVAAAPSVGAQPSAIIPPEARAALERADRASPTAQRDRQRALDVLTAARERWSRSRISSYAIQSHVECFCLPPERDSVPPLSIVRFGQITAHAAGRAIGYEPLHMTVDSLFAMIEGDIRDPGRIVTRFDVDSVYGLPRRYEAETPSIPDLWVRIVVDSFAVRP